LLPLLTTAQMREADAVAVAKRGVDALVNAAGTAVGLEAQRMLRRVYGSRIAVLVGPGLNGSDGRVAASWLRSRGAVVDVIEVARQPLSLDGFHLVIDAAFGLGCSRPYVAPRVAPNTLVLAVDLVSGVDADSGAVLGEPLGADVTIALGAIKPAHLDGPSSALTGELRFAGLGIVQGAENGVVEDRDLEDFLRGDVDDHKWRHAVQVLAGSVLMPGAAALAVRGALAGGASMVRLTSRGDITGLVRLPPEIVHAGAGEIDQRCRAVLAGPGLGSDAVPWLFDRLSDVQVPVVLDADGLDRSLISSSMAPERRWVLTPHDGEFERLTGRAVSASRFGAVRALARETGAVVLLKGPTTVIADSDGRLRVVRSGTPALATAGSGDVLSGLIAATIARGHDPFTAAALAAHLHGRAGAQLRVYAPASDLTSAVTSILTALEQRAGEAR
jgi:hydroxyethylthiazole kinase-like uncharacterized protein yjeF